MPPRTDYPLKLARPFGEYTAHLFNVINTRARVSLAVKYYFQLYFTLLCLFDERALFPGRLPTSCAVSVYYSRCLERKNLSQRLKEWSRWQCCFLLIGSLGLRVFFSKMATCFTTQGIFKRLHLLISKIKPFLWVVNLIRQVSSFELELLKFNT